MSVDKSRGFKSIKGKTIAKINTKAINAVKITFTDGTMFEIIGENWYKGIPALTCEKKESK